MTETLNKTILVINCGSSSIKFALIELPHGRRIVTGLAERLETSDATIGFKFGTLRSDTPLPSASHVAAIHAILHGLQELLGENLRIDGIGHRVVHGGQTFKSAMQVDENVIAEIERCSRLAPLHNPANAIGIRSAMLEFPDVPHVAVFDTAFHQTMPRHAALYAIPYEYYEKHDIRRYGMHGTSHHFVGKKTAHLLGRDFSAVNLITAHLGNGSSACAIRMGRSVDTTMGLTPLEGLMMGSRSGDVDPDLHLHLHENLGLSVREISQILNRKSGLLGVSGISNDLRTVMAAAEEGNERAMLAFDLLCYRLAKGIAGLTAALDTLDAVVFTGGIGENSAPVRERAISHLTLLKLKIDAGRNAVHGHETGGIISTPESSARVMVVPTDEEEMIAESTATFCSP
jgi:acetate kinase